MLTRRQLLQSLAGISAFPVLQALAAPHAGKVKITAIKAMALTNIAGNCLVRIDTDAGVTGYGEAGSTGPMARARIATMERLLLGKDPLAIEVHFHEMTSLMHTYTAHVPTVSGIDMALWDLAGKLLDKRVCELMGGPFRPAIRMYSHGNGVDMLDKGACAAWAQRVKSMPEGFTAFKFGVDQPLKIPAGRYATTVDGTQLRNISRGFANVREAAGDEIDIAAHCHGELDTPSAIMVAKVVEPMNPLFYEDPLNVAHSEGWMAVKRSTRIPILTGEKLELVKGFKPFLDTQACDIIHPDLAFCGGITGGKKIADYAQLTRTPVALHNVGSIVLTYANAHFGAGIFNFYRSESALGRPTRHVENMLVGAAPAVRGGLLEVPSGPGLGLNLNWEYIRKNLAPGEEWWG